MSRMNLLRIAILLVLAQPAPLPQAPATGSVEGVVVRLGTNTPITGADVELSRVEGTSAAPLPPGAAEVFARALVGPGNNRAQVPAAIASEVRYAKTGDDGKFAFKDLKEGKYRLVSIRIGGTYQPAEYGQRDPQGRGFNFPLAAGQAFKDAKLEMAPTVVITGKVTDENGQPIGHARVSALAARVENGRRYLAVMAAVHSDDKGNYRLFWLPPGRYYVAARLEDLSRRAVGLITTPPGRLISNDDASTPILSRRLLASGEMEEMTTGFVYYGGVLEPDRAKPMDILPGETFAGADIPLGLGKMPAWHIRGTVLDSNGQPAKGAGLRAIPRQWSPNIQVLTGTADANGNFDLVGAVQGSYALFATTLAPPVLNDVQRASLAAIGLDADRVVLGVTNELGYVAVDVGTGNVGGIKFNTTRGVGLSGRVTIEGRLPNPLGDPDLAKIVVSVRRDPNMLFMPDSMIPLPLPPVAPGATTVPQRPVNGQVAADGRFNILAGTGDFQVDVAGIPGNSYVKSIRMGNVDIMSGGLQLSGPADSPIEVVLGIDGGEVTGTAVNDRQESMTNVIVALVPESPLLRRRYDLYRSATTDFAGKFRLQNIPPGTYKLFSWEYVETDAWQDAQFLQPYETAGKIITVREGSSQQTQAKVSPLRR
jgi:protocatechuate 3,4-dioxygenase beta subunit